MLIHTLFEQQVDRHPHAIALSVDNQLVSYAELNTRSNLLAHQLRDLGVQHEDHVAVLSELGVDAFIASLAVLKAGGACVPLDPTCPSTYLHAILKDCDPRVMIAQEHVQKIGNRFRNVPIIELSVRSLAKLDQTRVANLSDESCFDDSLAYILYERATRTPPVGVAIEHRNLTALVDGLSQAAFCDQGDTITVDKAANPSASLVESLWALCTGGRLALLNHADYSSEATATPSEGMDFSLFYFSSIDNAIPANKYYLLMEGAQFADANGFTGVWTPERHFHSFGGLFPNPSVTSAAIAATTRRVKIRAGSVVLPLHNVLRVVEEWSVVDNLSNGRVELAFASGWNANDFVLSPESYQKRRDIMFSGIDTFLKLWRGEAYNVPSGTGKTVSVKTYPRPIQEQPKIWLAATGRQETFARAGSMGVNLLTHLFDHNISGLAENIALYRTTLLRNGYDPNDGRVALMLHTFMGNEREAVKDMVRGPLTDYLRSSIDLTQSLAAEAGRFSRDSLSNAELDKLMEFSFNKYFDGTALLGTVDDCLPLVQQLKRIGVDEIACLIDFGVASDEVLRSLHHLAELSESVASHRNIPSVSVPSFKVEERVGMTRLTSAALKRYLAKPAGCAFVRSLPLVAMVRDDLSSELLASVKEAAVERVVTVYGFSETTLWSAVCDIGYTTDLSCIGRPLAHTRFYILDDQKNPLPTGQFGEIYIGGAGVARGYLNQPRLTADRFFLDPFICDGKARIYRTGHYGRICSDGRIEAM